MIYLLATAQLHTGKLQEFSDILSKEYLPIAEKHGQKLVGAWRTVVGNVDEITDLWAFNSLAHFEQVRGALAQNPDWQKAYARLRSVIAAESHKIIGPLSFSPLK
ncbi:MAG: NIPSNAP family protein [Dehalococcoidia bacterium]|nr:NIPSNAP family protein [Dehalococcoidia bacterium]